jgi:hypothetical protein
MFALLVKGWLQRLHAINLRVCSVCVCLEVWKLAMEPTMLTPRCCRQASVAVEAAQLEDCGSAGAT